jgi:hypothetical protein
MGLEVWLHFFLSWALGEVTVSFTLRMLYVHGKSPGYPSNRRLGGPQR